MEQPNHDNSKGYSMLSKGRYNEIKELTKMYMDEEDARCFISHFETIMQFNPEKKKYNKPGGEYMRRYRNKQKMQQESNTT